MSSRLRIAAGALCVLSFLVLPSFAARSYADPIDLANDVDIAWGNQRCFPALNFFACGSPVVIEGGLRVVTEAERDDLLIDLTFFTSTAEIDSYSLFLDVAFPATAPGEIPQLVEIGGSPLQLTVAESTFDGAGGIIEPLTFALSDFALFNSLPSGTLVFRLGGTLNGNSSFGDCPTPGYVFSDDDLNNIPDNPCPEPAPASTVPGARIVISGGSSLTGDDPTRVPEPATLTLLLVGLAVAGVRRRRK